MPKAFVATIKGIRSYCESTPILEIEQIVWTNSGVNLEYSRSRNLYNNRSYIMVETSH
ncbi:transcriptional regulator [Lactobacillus delbrueckii]|uniref:transcriptional regulator n=1 Tax=Lactobacillus delbrueckii TaxID=1584 RepID=UPI0037CC30C2